MTSQESHGKGKNKKEKAGAKKCRRETERMARKKKAYMGKQMIRLKTKKRVLTGLIWLITD